MSKIKIKEQGYNLIASNIADKKDADELARQKRGVVVQDPKDEKKFAVMVEEGRVQNRVSEGTIFTDYHKLEGDLTLKGYDIAVNIHRKKNDKVIGYTLEIWGTDGTDGWNKIYDKKFSSFDNVLNSAIHTIKDKKVVEFLKKNKQKIKQEIIDTEIAGRSEPSPEIDNIISFVRHNWSDKNRTEKAKSFTNKLEKKYKNKKKEISTLRKYFNQIMKLDKELENTIDFDAPPEDLDKNKEYNRLYDEVEDLEKKIKELYYSITGKAVEGRVPKSPTDDKETNLIKSLKEKFGLNEISDEWYERANGLVNIENLNQFKKLVGSLAEDLVEDGADYEDAAEYLSAVVSTTLGLDTNFSEKKKRVKESKSFKINEQELTQDEAAIVKNVISDNLSRGIDSAVRELTQKYGEETAKALVDHFLAEAWELAILGNEYVTDPIPLEPVEPEPEPGEDELDDEAEEEYEDDEMDEKKKCTKKKNKVTEKNNQFVLEGTNTVSIETDDKVISLFVLDDGTVTVQTVDKTLVADQPIPEEPDTGDGESENYEEEMMEKLKEFSIKFNEEKFDLIREGKVVKTVGSIEEAKKLSMKLIEEEDPKPDPVPDPNPDPKPDQEPDPKPDPEPDPKPDPELDPKPDPELDPDIDDDAETDAETDDMLDKFN